MNDYNYYFKEEFKQCAGRGCSNRADVNLDLMFLHKQGWFCEECSTYLLQNKLAEEIRKKVKST
jgi:hypothetical protein